MSIDISIWNIFDRTILYGQLSRSRLAPDSKATYASSIIPAREFVMIFPIVHVSFNSTGMLSANKNQAQLSPASMPCGVRLR